MKNRYRLVAIVGIALVVSGIVFVMILPTAFPVEKRDSFTGIVYTVSNTAFSYSGIALIVIGGVTTFFGRYRYTREEEKEDIERAKREG